MKNLDTPKFAFRKTTITIFAKPAAGAAKDTLDILIPTTSSGCNSTSSYWGTSVADSQGI